MPTYDEIASFSEESAILELLLRHIYPNAAPDLDTLDFETLGKLADAAEKYHIFSVMEICRLHMKYLSSTLVSNITVDDAFQRIRKKSPP